MANLSKAVFKSKMTCKMSGFDSLNRLLNRLEEATEKMPENLQKWTKDDALSMSRELSTNAQNAIARLPARERLDHPTFTTYITEIRGGYNVAIAGKNIWYYEFGTGDQGAKSKYPSKALARRDYVYNAGPKVIHAGDDLVDAPNWYVGMVTKHPEKAQGNWWMSPHGPSDGIPAGKFFYDTYKGFRHGLTSNEEAMTYELNRNSIHLKVRDGILKGKWR